MGRLGVVILAAIPLVAAFVLVTTPHPLQEPLWPNSQFTELDRQRSLLRGLEFIYSTASNTKHFQADGNDLLWCFYSLSAAAADPELKKRAWKMGQERAREWRRTNDRVPPDIGADEILDMAYGSLSAELLDVRDDALKAELKTVARRHTAEEYLQFDPAKEPPPRDVPQNCAKCSSTNSRGVKLCKKCGMELRMTSPYDILCNALIATHTASRYGMWIGGSYDDVAQWIPKMRPYPPAEEGRNSRINHEAAYAVTHIVYTLNDYTLYKLRPEWLPREYEYLRTNLKLTMAENDLETLGEFLDTLRSFGMDESDSLMQSGVEFLLQRQNSDGSWGRKQNPDPYASYHTTWTAMNGVMQYEWRGEGTIFPEALRRIRAGNQ